jgi:hypothetical protein
MNGIGKSMKQWRGKMKFRNCGRIIAIVILMSFLITPVYGEPPTAQPKNSTESGMRLYSEFEVDTLIEDLTVAAEEAIERAAAEAAKAAALAGIEREAAALREAQQWQRQYQDARSRGVRNAVIAGVICFFSGLVIGAGGVLIIQGGR